MESAEDFERKRKESISGMALDDEFAQVSQSWFEQSIRHRYSYNFSWLGRPVIQYPQDLIALQEIIWDIKPDLIVETGIAHGGSLVFYASMLKLLDNNGLVIGIDVELRNHNRQALEEHPLKKGILLLDGSSTDCDIVSTVYRAAETRTSVLVVLDSLHSHEHVLAELHSYADLVKTGGYLVVLDTIIEFLSSELTSGRPWGPGDNPYTAVKQFLAETDRFVVDREITDKIAFSAAPHGYLRCIKS